VGHGEIVIHLSTLIERSGMSKNRFSHLAAMERTQINNYCNNKVARVDLDVLARICSTLDCTIGELLEYVPEEPKT
jgi:putative transcriptional regulator